MTQEVNFTLDEYKKIINSSYDGILITDANGVIVMCNESWLQITRINGEGYNLNSIIGVSMHRFIETGFIKDSAVFASLRKNGPIVMTQTTKSTNIFMTSANLVYDEENNIKYVIVNVKDITELTTLQRELEQSKRLQELYLKSLNTFKEAPEDEPIAASAVMKNILNKCLKISDTDVTVLILGESGTGKEVLARYIHECSTRRNAPFVTVNCGAIPNTLLESELFGYACGAFTGANRHGKKGLFELANDGTLFLDEIGELELNMQVKLLHVLETRQFTRIGSTDPINISARILTATNRNLKEMVAMGKFRSDLYYRINVVNIEIPPLRERSRDIPALAIYFLNTYNIRYKRNKKLSYEAFQRLSDYSWPGNIRELRNVMEQLVVLSSGEYVDVELFDTILEQDHIPSHSPAVKVNRLLPMKEAVAEVEKQVLSLAQCRNLSSRQIAELMGVNQTTISRKLRRYGLGKRR